MRFVQSVLVAVAGLVLLAGCSESSPTHPAQSHDSHAPAIEQQAQGDEHSHDHDHGAVTLTLNDGSKWETDEALRHAMGSILALVEPHLHEHAGTDLAPLAHGVHSNIEYMVQNCRLEPQADAVLHVIIGEMFEGIALLQDEQGEAARQEGVGRIAQALQNYGDYFDHPDFAVPHAH